MRFDEGIPSAIIDRLGQYDAFSRSFDRCFRRCIHRLFPLPKPFDSTRTESRLITLFKSPIVFTSIRKPSFMETESRSDGSSALAGCESFPLERKALQSAVRAKSEMLWAPSIMLQFCKASYSCSDSLKLISLVLFRSTAIRISRDKEA